MRMSVSVSALLHAATMPTTPEVGAQQTIAPIADHCLSLCPHDHDSTLCPFAHALNVKNCLKINYRGE